MEPKLENAVKTAFLDCLNLKKEETVLVLTDDQSFELGDALYQKAKELANTAHLLLMPVAKVNGEEPPASIAELMTRYDVVVCPTAKSLTHTDAKRKACARGARVATMPGITTAVFTRTMMADYGKIDKRTRFISSLLEKTDVVKITTGLGTDMVIPVKGMPPISSGGIIREKGRGGNIPSGESFLAPVEGKTNGILMVDASVAGIGLIDEPIKITIKDGFAVSFEGGMQAKQLEQQLNSFGKPGLNVAELGIGTNDEAIITGQILEDEKVFGTIHIAFGNNITMGGTCNVGIHIDCIVTKPDMWFDNRKIMEQGKLLIEDIV
jgi:leucyl aminopeptidase (aminopeptidase T)